jgi:hypothetical protein
MGAGATFYVTTALAIAGRLVTEQETALPPNAGFSGH